MSKIDELLFYGRYRIPNKGYHASQVAWRRLSVPCKFKTEDGQCARRNCKCAWLKCSWIPDWMRGFWRDRDAMAKRLRARRAKERGLRGEEA